MGARDERCHPQPGMCACFDTQPRLGDENWKQAHAELLAVHYVKSGGYGTNADPLANFTTVAASSGRAAYLYPLERITEKIARCMSLEAQGRTGELAEEFTDIASLALCAEALRRRDAA